MKNNLLFHLANLLNLDIYLNKVLVKEKDLLIHVASLLSLINYPIEEFLKNKKTFQLIF